MTDKAPLRVGLDDRNISLAHGTGVATYGAVLAGCLPSIGMRAEILRAGPPQHRAQRWLFAGLGGPSQAQRTPAGWVADDLYRIAQVQFDLSRHLRGVRFENPPDVMHWTSPLPLRALGCPSLVTLHDLIPLLYPELCATQPTRLLRMLSLILRTVDHVVTVSEATRREALRHLPLRDEQVTNAWQAVDVDGAAPRTPSNLVPGSYWLHVGTVERRKNLVRLIRAWRASGVAGMLVLAGPDGWQAAEVVAECGGDPAILRLPWLPRPTLLALMRDARALLMPSLAEGFGLPLAEAMALRVPALVAGSGAMAEVAAGGAMLIDPMSIRSIAEGISALDCDPALRARLVATAAARAVDFTPAAHAARLNHLYCSVVSRAAARR